MKLFFYVLTTFFTLIFSNVQGAFASCDVGPVLFRDTIYGAAVGAGVGALVLISSGSSSNIGQTIATSTLIGSGAGLVVGVVEISLSNCSSGGNHKSRSENSDYGFNVKPLFTIVNNN